MVVEILTMMMMMMMSSHYLIWLVYENKYDKVLLIFF